MTAQTALTITNPDATFSIKVTPIVNGFLISVPAGVVLDVWNSGEEETEHIVCQPCQDEVFEVIQHDLFLGERRINHTLNDLHDEPPCYPARSVEL